MRKVNRVRSKMTKLDEARQALEELMNIVDGMEMTYNLDIATGDKVRWAKWQKIVKG